MRAPLAQELPLIEFLFELASLPLPNAMMGTVDEGRWHGQPRFCSP